VSGSEPRRPSSVLFVCGQNVVRSPMAAAIARHLFPNSIYVRSAGVRPGDPDPFAQAVMQEIGLDLGQHRPKLLEDLEDTNFDLAVTDAVEAQYWLIIDPSAAMGSRAQILDSYRAVRDELHRRIRARFGLPPLTDGG